MATKTISISEDSYNILLSRKKDKESFSEVIKKLAGNTNFLDLIGVISNDKAKEFKKNILEFRKRSRERSERLFK